MQFVHEEGKVFNYVILTLLHMFKNKKRRHVLLNTLQNIQNLRHITSFRPKTYLVDSQNKTKYYIASCSFRLLFCLTYLFVNN